MKTAVLINDTSLKAHIGCRIVVAQIAKLARASGINLIATCSVHLDWRTQPAVLEAMQKCDLVIVNGEGTLHDSSVQAQALAAVAPYCRELGIPSFLINSVYENNDATIAENCRQFHRIFVRESRSAAVAEKDGLNISIVPDLTLSSDAMIGTKDSRSRFIIVTDNANREIGKKCINYALSQKDVRFLRLDISNENNPFLPDSNFQVFKTGTESKVGKSFSTRKAFLRSFYRPHPLARMRMLREFARRPKADELLLEMQSSKAVIAGRFHAACLALLAGTNFAAMPSNTGKTGGMMKDAGLDHFCTTSPKEAFELAASWQAEDIARAEAYVLKARQDATRMFDEITQVVS